MTAISKDAKLVTLINTFTVHGERQDELVAILNEATTEVMSKLPGFISANVHGSPDGRHVANYAQWESLDAFQAMLKDPKAKEHMSKCMGIAEAEPILYQVRSVFNKT